MRTCRTPIVGRYRIEGIYTYQPLIMTTLHSELPAQFKLSPLYPAESGEARGHLHSKE